MTLNEMLDTLNNELDNLREEENRNAISFKVDQEVVCKYMKNNKSDKGYIMGKVIKAGKMIVTVVLEDYKTFQFVAGKNPKSAYFLQKNRMNDYVLFPNLMCYLEYEEYNNKYEVIKSAINDNYDNCSLTKEQIDGIHDIIENKI